MDILLVDLLKSTWLSSSFLSSTCSTKCVDERKQRRRILPSEFHVVARKKKPKAEIWKKELSEMLWTKAAIKDIESKGDGKRR